MRFQQAPYRIADVVALLFILHGNTSFGSLAPIIPYRSCKHYLGLVGCSNASDESVTGTIKFYSEATKEFTTPLSATPIELSKDQIEKIKALLNNVEEWVDDRLVNRLEYNFDGEFELSDGEFVYYFTYESDVIYYDHYIGKITAEEMQFIKSIEVTE